MKVTRVERLHQNSLSRGRIHPVTLIPLHRFKEPIRGRRFSIRDNIDNAMRQQVTRFANAHSIQRLPHSCQRVMTVEGDDIESL
ncbi:hypothetical protein TNCV_140641 [Trichonephila clavipes]|uniref:Uncharacterized protein n=1 Tax=Trichonephila clavipes TaxID=2585209 RepID=A0A8X6RMI3_TRICX|nr:hypothetical protein TNCV_140641 [Trichonephila clavipes]